MCVREGASEIQTKVSLRLSGSSERPAYPRFIVIHTAGWLREIVVPSNTKVH